MILTWTCDLCGWANDNNAGPCRHCDGQTEERQVRGKWQTVLTRQPAIDLRGFYNPKVRDPQNLNRHYVNQVER